MRLLCRNKQSAASQSSMHTAATAGRYAGHDMMVPKTLLEEKVQELLAKDETIQVVSTMSSVG